MAIDFPAGAANGATHSAAGVVWRYDGVKWQANSAVVPGDITSVTAGTGLTGGGTVGDLTLALQTPVSIANGGTGSTTAAAAPFVEIAGDSMTGGLTLSPPAGADPVFTLAKTASGRGNYMIGKTGANNRWVMEFGSAEAESGSNAGSNFILSRWSDGGAWIDNPLAISRANGSMSFAGSVLGVNGGILEVVGSGASTAQYTAQMKLGYHGINAYGMTFQPNVDNGNAVIFNNAAKTLVGQIANTATSTSYATSSDGRLKEDLQSFDAGRIIDATNVYDFAWKATGERGYGVVAQEAALVYPQAVAQSSDAWGVDYSKYVPLLLQEIKTLRVRLAALEA